MSDLRPPLVIVPPPLAVAPQIPFAARPQLVAVPQQGVSGATLHPHQLLAPDPNVPLDLAQVGLRLVTQDYGRPCQIVEMAAWEGQGKTHRACEFPGPIVYLEIDTGTRGVVEKFVGGVVGAKKTIYKVNLRMGLHVLNPAVKDEELAREALRVWTQLTQVYYAALRSAEVRTIVFDTESKAWEILRLARFGKTTQVPPDLYNFVNSEMRGLLMDAANYDKNVILLRTLKEEWVDDVSMGGQRRSHKTGGDKVEGFKEVQYAADLRLRLYRDQVGQWHTAILKSRLNPALVGMDLVGEMASCQNLMPMVFLPQGGPGTTAEYWR